MAKRTSKCTIEGPMRSPWPMPSLTAVAGDYDHNPGPGVIAKPRDRGKDSVPLRFTEGMHGATVKQPKESMTHDMGGRRRR